MHISLKRLDDADGDLSIFLDYDLGAVLSALSVLFLWHIRAAIVMTNAAATLEALEQSSRFAQLLVDLLRAGIVTIVIEDPL